jgi:hypothetical protein
MTARVDSKINHDITQLVLYRRLASTYPTSISIENVVDRTIMLMQWVEKLKDMDGQQKKDIVLGVLMRAANDIPDTAGGPGTVEVMIKMAMPKLIDWIIVADGNGIDVNTNVSVCAGKTLNCVSSCFK